MEKYSRVEKVKSMFGEEVNRGILEEPILIEDNIYLVAQDWKDGDEKNKRDIYRRL